MSRRSSVGAGGGGSFVPGRSVAHFEPRTIFMAPALPRAIHGMHRAPLTTSIPCDTPLHPREELASSMGGMFSDLDFSGLSEGYASKQGIFDPERAAERAEMVRKWLRERPEQEIVRECRRRKSSHSTFSFLSSTSFQERGVVANVARVQSVLWRGIGWGKPITGGISPRPTASGDHLSVRRVARPLASRVPSSFGLSDSQVWFG